MAAAFSLLKSKEQDSLCGDTVLFWPSDPSTHYEPWAASITQSSWANLPPDAYRKKYPQRFLHNGPAFHLWDTSRWGWPHWNVTVSWLAFSCSSGSGGTGATWSRAIGWSLQAHYMRQSACSTSPTHYGHWCLPRKTPPKRWHVFPVLGGAPASRSAAFPHYRADAELVMQIVPC